MLNEQKYKHKKKKNVPKEKIIAIAIVVVVAILAVLGNIGAYNLCQRDVRELQNTPVAETPEELNELMRSGSEKFLIYGTVSTDNPVGYPDIGQKYIYAKKVAQERTQHVSVRRVGKTYFPRHYYRWDTKSAEETKCRNINMLELSIPCDSVMFSGDDNKVTTLANGDNSRCVYYGFETGQPGTVLVTMSGGHIESAELYYNMDIQGLIDSCGAKTVNCMMLYWMAWLVIGVIAFLCYNDII